MRLLSALVKPPAGTSSRCSGRARTWMVRSGEVARLLVPERQPPDRPTWTYLRPSQSQYGNAVEHDAFTPEELSVLQVADAALGGTGADALLGAGARPGRGAHRRGLAPPHVIPLNPATHVQRKILLRRAEDDAVFPCRFHVEVAADAVAFLVQLFLGYGVGLLLLVFLL